MIIVGPPVSPISSLWCDACAEGWHADCVRLWECTCYAYGQCSREAIQIEALLWLLPRAIDPEARYE